MTTHNLFTLRLLRCMTIGTRRLVSGATLDLDGPTAAELVRAGQAVLVDIADITVLAEHASAGRRRAIPAGS